MLLYDTTLRDGAQAQSVTFSLQDKEQILYALDKAGIHYIEAGNPASNPRDEELFLRLAKVRLASAHIVAFGSTRRANTTPSQDASFLKLAHVPCMHVAVFGKSSLFQVHTVLRTTAQENMNMISDSVSYLKEAGKTVFFDAEHFFDGYFCDAAYALATLATAHTAGADHIVLCDTNGGTLPHDITRITQEVCKLYPNVGIHCHNDAGVAVAASLCAINAGANSVQGTIGGLGERCGNTDLCTLIPNLQVKMGISCIPDLSVLTPLYHLVLSIANLTQDKRHPYVGSAAFAHKGGMHIDGVLKNSDSFEHIPPELVGNTRNFLLSDLAGRASLYARIHKIFPTISKEDPCIERIFSRLKQMEFEGYYFEEAQDSFDLLIRRELNLHKCFYEVLDFQVICQRPEDVTSTIAIIKVRVGNKVELTCAQGDGPVNALDCALRKVLTLFYPQLAKLKLTDFKVRVVDSDGGTSSRVRVFICSTDGLTSFGTVGVSTSILQAAWIALVDSIDAMLLT